MTRRLTEGILSKGRHGFPVPWIAVTFVKDPLDEKDLTGVEEDDEGDERESCHSIG
jgi:hypothetical protein